MLPFRLETMWIALVLGWVGGCMAAPVDEASVSRSGDVSLGNASAPTSTKQGRQSFCVDLGYGVPSWLCDRDPAQMFGRNPTNRLLQLARDAAERNDFSALITHVRGLLRQALEEAPAEAPAYVQQDGTFVGLDEMLEGIEATTIALAPIESKGPLTTAAIAVGIGLFCTGANVNLGFHGIKPPWTLGWSIVICSMGMAAFALSLLIFI